MKKSNSAQIKEDMVQIKILLDQLSNVQDADSASAISTIRGTVSTMKHRFDGDAPASSGLTERDRKLENTKDLEEFVDEGHDAQLKRFRDRIKDHARAVNEDLKRLKNVLKDINDACSSMKNSYDDRHRVVDGILVILRNALRDAAPGVYKSRVDRSFEDYTYNRRYRFRLNRLRANLLSTRLYPCRHRQSLILWDLKSLHRQ